MGLDSVCLYAVLLDMIDDTQRLPVLDDGSPVRMPIARERKDNPELQYDDLIDKNIGVTPNVDNWRLMLRTRALHNNRDKYTLYDMTRLVLLIRANTKHG